MIFDSKSLQGNGSDLRLVEMQNAREVAYIVAYDQNHYEVARAPSLTPPHYRFRFFWFAKKLRVGSMVTSLAAFDHHGEQVKISMEEARALGSK